jgi:microcin C transport system permease protein
MSPLMRNRLYRFKQNKLGFFSLILFLIIFSLSICAEFIANDNPLLVSYKQSLYFPLFKDF